MAAKYMQVVDWIRERLDSGKLRNGDKLESENEICASFHLSRQTVRRALAILEREGRIMKVQGSGTFVSSGSETVPVINQNLSRTITIMSTYTDGYIFPRILQTMVKSLGEAGYDARILFTENRLEQEREYLQRMIEDEAGSPLIAEPVMSGLPNPNLEYYEELRRRGIPVLFFHSSYEGLDIPCIRMDDVEAGRLATDYLIQKGHRRISGIFKLDDGQGRRRYQGYLKALRQNGIELREDRVCWTDTMEMLHFGIMKPKLDMRLSGCTACVCYNDEVAHELTSFLEQEGKQIPRDLSIVSIDNSELANLNSIRLTSVAHPMELLGQKTAENMIRLIRDPGYDASYLFPVKLTERDSVLAEE